MRLPLIGGLLAAWRDVAAHWRLADGGPADAWRTLWQQLRHRHMTILTMDGTREPLLPALRTRIALGGGVLTEVSAAWWKAARSAERDDRIADHFRRVRAATLGWAAVVGLVDLLRAVMLALAGGSFMADLLTLALRGWNGLDWTASSTLVGVVLPSVLLLLGSLLRLAFRLLLRWRFRVGLARAGSAAAPIHR